MLVLEVCGVTHGCMQDVSRGGQWSLISCAQVQDDNYTSIQDKEQESGIRNMAA